jgi:hypothetical protein
VCRALSRQRFSKHVPAAADTYKTIEIFLKTVFSTWLVQRGSGRPGWGSLESETVKYGHESRGTRTQ